MGLKSNWVTGDLVTPTDLNSIDAAVNLLVDRPLPRNSTVMGLGASIVTWGTLDSCYLPYVPDNFISHMCIESMQRMKFGGILGHGGYTQAQIISTYLPTLLAITPAPGACIYIDGPYNDIATGVSFAQTKANLNTVISALISNGIVPILGTTPSLYYGPVHQADYAQWNRYIRRFAANNGYALIDMQTVISAIDATDIASLAADAVHPSSYGHKLIASKALSDGISDIFPPCGNVLTSRWIGDMKNILNDGTSVNIGLFNADANADGVADGWSVNAGVAANCAVVAPTVSDNLLGNWQQISNVIGVTNTWLVKLPDVSLFSAGDILAVSARVQTSGVHTTGAGWSLAFTQYFSGGYNYPAPGVGAANPAGYLQSGCIDWLTDVEDGLLYCEVPVVAGASLTYAGFSLAGAVNPGTALLRVGEFTIVNLTTGALL